VTQPSKAGAWNVPTNWVWADVSSVAETTSGGTPRRDRPEYYGGQIPWLKSGELRDRTVFEVEEYITEEGLRNSSAKVFPKGTLCIALYGATVGKLAILGLASATNQAICGIFPATGIDPRFLFRFLELIRPELIELGKGGAQPNISQGIVRSTFLPLAPSNEQIRIVEEIEKQFTRLDAAVAALKRVRSNLKRYRASVLKAACEGCLVPTEAELARKEGRGYLHGVGGDNCPIDGGVDSLAEKPSVAYEMVLTNPPFGKKSSITVINEEGDESKEALTYVRDDFWATTSNKQLNFLQHVKSCLKIHGRAAIVVPDNVLFEGGAGETIRRELLKQADVHTLLRLPTGIFYAQGVKANVLFFDRKPASATPWTKALWIYDFRTNEHFTLKTNPLKRGDLDDFVSSYNAENRHERKETERFKSFTYEDLLKRDKVSLDIFWLKDESLEDSANLPDPDVIAAEIAEDLQAALDQFTQIAADLRK
jgi:hypothetical protein